jgi:hypothetical protein
MKIFSRKILSLICMFIANNAFGAAEKTPLLIPRELKLDAFKIEQLNQGQKSYSIAISQNFTSIQEKTDDFQSPMVWILKDLKIWGWNLFDNSLMSFDLHLLKNETNPSTQHAAKNTGKLLASPLLQYKRKLFFSISNYFYQFDIESKKFYRLLFDQSKTGRVLNIIGQEDFVWILTTKGFFKFNLIEKTIIDYKAYDLRFSNNQGIFLDSEKFVTLSKKNVVMLDVKDLNAAQSSAKISSKNIYKTRNKFIGIKKIDENLFFVNTPKNIIKFNEVGKILQTIPIEKGRELIESFIEPTSHAFLFNDGLLEIFDQKTKKIMRLIVPVDKHNPIIKFELAGPYLIIQYTDYFRAFNVIEASEYITEQHHEDKNQ